ncbi:hypothetical protein E8L99_00100 [Phreatobacter aquaticus]|uniref:Uncharacterized protein n=1 Tax=Phreatobacter aquaticus TaxID=2570229 RepID=A0A4D7QCS3_9HYPH|nr:hypothetical protein [Phreatobacter aquaticus]QCK84305.1 hypothetical protein E8L99_00100 [Phreatobacter aquaticus]
MFRRLWLTIHRPVSAPLFLKAFVVTLAGIALAVAGINLAAFRLMLRPENQSAVQLISGYERTYKPILFDQMRPGIAVFGFSHARDAFDPVDLQAISGLPAFNMGMSGGTAYEIRRFAQSAAATGSLRHALINLNGLYGGAGALQTQYGFDDRLLNVDPVGQPTSFVALNRAIAVTLSGAAIGTNAEVLMALMRIGSGTPKETVLAAYDRFDFTRRAEWVQAARDRILDGRSWGEREPQGYRGRREEQGTFEDLEIAVTTLCSAGVAVHAYFTPRHVLNSACVPNAARETAMYDTLKRLQAACPAGLTFHAFDYPNRITLDGLIEPKQRSELYRADLHPRPTLGRLIAARILGRPLPAGSIDPGPDFGADLLAMSRTDAEAWVSARKRRCIGEWTEEGRAGLR